MDTIKKFQVAATSTFIIGFGAFLYYDHSVNEPKAAAAQHELEKEFAAIRPFDRAIESGFQSTHKSNLALVGDGYSTPASFDEIRLYYIHELERLEWRAQGDKAVKDWGRDLGGKTTTFCKGPNKASLEYYGDASNYRGHYRLELSWGIGPKCSA